MQTFFFDTAIGRVILTFAEALALLVPLLIGVAYLTYAERKVLAAMQLRQGPNVVGPFGLLQPFADALKMLMKETIIPAGANRLLFLLAPMLTFVPGAGRLGGDPVERRLGDRRHQCRHALSVRDQLARRLRHHHRRLGVQLELRLPRRAAHRGADGELRGLDGLRHGHRAALRRQAEPDRHRAGAAEGLVLSPAVPDVHRVLHLDAGRDQPRAVRPAGRRERDRRRLHRRIQRDGLRAVLPRRIRQHDPDERADHDPVPRRLAGAVRRCAVHAGSRARSGSS